MDKRITRLVHTFLLVGSLTAFADPVIGRSIFSPRSTSVNAARELVGWHRHIHRSHNDNFYAVFTATPGISHSIRAERIANALFGRDSFLVRGSLTGLRNDQSLLADYFGLSPAFSSRVTVSPFIQTAFIAFNAYLGLDNWVPGLYFRFHAPAVWTKWGLRMCERVFDDGTDTPYPARYMDEAELQAPARSFVQALQGGLTFGHMQSPLRFGRVCENLTDHGLSEIQIAAGYDIVASSRGYAGFNLRFSVPTGSRPRPGFLFAPFVGNAKHWEFGAGFSGRALIWEKDGRQELSFFGEINATHLFNGRQCRSFDFKGDCDTTRYMSRYMLLKEFDSTGRYTGNLVPAINVTTLDVDVSVDIQFDILLMFGYLHDGFNFDFGYNAWIRSKERIFLNTCLPKDRYGIKGIQDVITNANQPSIATQTTATIFGNELSEQGTVIDNPSPQFINTQDLDLRSAGMPRLLTHKLFTHLGYSWLEAHRAVTPFFGIGGEIEFEGINERADINPHHNSLSQWSFWAKGGITF